MIKIKRKSLYLFAGLMIIIAANLAFSSYGVVKTVNAQLKAYEVTRTVNADVERLVYSVKPEVHYEKMISYEKIYAAGNEKTVQEIESIPEESESSVDVPKVIEIPDMQTGEPILFEDMQNVNRDVCAWIRIPGTAVDYPVLQSKDNNDYLHKSWAGTESRVGSIFIDCTNSGFEQSNTIIYGHNMLDGTMFAEIARYIDQGFYLQHPTIQIYTPTEIVEAKIFAAYTTASTSEAFSKIWTQEYLDLIQARTVLTTDMDVSLDNRIVTLVTCDYSTFDNARMVVHAIL